MNRVYSFFGGTSRFFAFFFAVSGTALAFRGKLTGDYVAMITALQALIVAHSVKEDLLPQSSGDPNASTSSSNQ